MTLRIMLDLETMSTAPNAAIVQIGACANDGRPDFNAHVTLESSVKAGLHLDPKTVEWWLFQSEEARTSVFRAPMRGALAAALIEFSKWLAPLRGAPVECELWAFPAAFDVTILESAYRVCGMTTPWHYRAPRCLRTVCSLFPDIPRVKSALLHDALSDAKAQMQYLEALLARLSVATTLPRIVSQVRL